LAEPTRSAVPNNKRAARTTPIDPGASHIPIAVVKTTIDVMRGLAKSRRSRTEDAGNATAETPGPDGIRWDSTGFTTGGF
jgi:hypothetical protein